MIAVFGAILAPLILLINALLWVIEWIVGLFTGGVTIGRIRSRKKDRAEAKSFPAALFVVTWFVILGFAGIFFWSHLTKREITVLADDGRPVMAALMEMQAGGSIDYQRTNSVGKITVPRFGLTAIRMKDSRYVEKEWLAGAVTSELKVQRTILGSGLDKLKSSLLDRVISP